MADIKSQFILNFIEKDRWRLLVDGLGNTLKITAVACLIGICIGVIIAIVRSTWDKNHLTMRPGIGKTLLGIVNGICKVYLTVIRGTPVVVQLMIIYYIIFASSRNSLAIAMLAFGINSGAYVAEIVRGGIMSIDEGQFEAGRSLGFNYVRTMQYIIIPQVFKNVLPTLANEFIVLLKDTSLITVIGGKELSLFDVNEAANIVNEAADPNAVVIFGAVIDESLNDEIRVTVIATGFEKKSPVTKNTVGGPASINRNNSGIIKNFSDPNEIPPWLRH